MNEKQVVPRQRAAADVRQAIIHYREQAPSPVAQRFVGAYEDALLHISRFPGSGSLRFGNRTSVDGLRSWPISGFPYVAVYIERDDHIDLGRVLHTARNIPESLADDFAD